MHEAVYVIFPINGICNGEIGSTKMFHGSCQGGLLKNVFGKKNILAKSEYQPQL